jgi:hypothetical protein
MLNIHFSFDKMDLVAPTWLLKDVQNDDKGTNIFYACKHILFFFYNHALR